MGSACLPACRPACRTEKLELKPATAQLGLWLGLSLAITPDTKSETFQMKIDEHEQNFEVPAAEGFESAINDFTEVDEDIEVDNEENENAAAISGIDEPIKNSNVVALKKMTLKLTVKMRIVPHPVMKVQVI